MKIFEGEGFRGAREVFSLEGEVEECDGCGTERLSEVEDDEELELLGICSVGGC